MILRDPVFGLVSFSDDTEKLIVALLGTKEVQRLRRIRQLGLTSLVFPGAEHTRFAHALGAAHVFQLVKARLKSCEGDLDVADRLTENEWLVGTAAALLHDVGHGPFSHLFEEVFESEKDHEAWTQEIILSPDTDVHKVLSTFGKDVPLAVSALLRGEHRTRWLPPLLSGTFDVDRADYLLRDSYMSGVAYGQYDLPWLIQALGFGTLEGKAQVVIEGRKGLPPVESFFLARHYMYEQVYHHKATRAAEALLRAIFQRVKILSHTKQALNHVPHAWLNLEEVGLSHYLELDDNRLMVTLAEWSKEGDQELSQMCAALLRRELLKTLPLPVFDGPTTARLLEEAQTLAVTKQEFASCVSLDCASDVPYPQKNELWVNLKHQPLTRLGDLSVVLGGMRGMIVEKRRLIFPEKLKQDMESLVRCYEGN